MNFDNCHHLKKIKMKATNINSPILENYTLIVSCYFTFKKIPRILSFSYNSYNN